MLGGSRTLGEDGSWTFCSRLLPLWYVAGKIAVLIHAYFERQTHRLGGCSNQNLLHASPGSSRFGGLSNRPAAHAGSSARSIRLHQAPAYEEYLTTLSPTS